MKEVTAQEAFDLMSSDAEYVYLDVRSIPEFEAGHPLRAINVPIMHLAPGLGMTPNEDFSAVAGANLSKDAKLIVGCKTGMRSARAAEVLIQMGFTNVANMRGGFSGMTDNTGRMVAPGWSTSNLPVCGECTEVSRYEHLAARAKK